MPNWKAFGKVGLTIAKVMVPQEALSGRELVDVALFQEGLSQVNDGMVKIMNALHVQVPTPNA
jgi:hypothetical protein